MHDNNKVSIFFGFLSGAGFLFLKFWSGTEWQIISGPLSRVGTKPRLAKSRPQEFLSERSQLSRLQSSQASGKVMRG